MLKFSLEYFKYLMENSDCKKSVLKCAVNAMKVYDNFLTMNIMINEKSRKLIIIADNPGMGKLLH